MARSGRDEPFTEAERVVIRGVMIAFKRFLAAPPDSKDERRCADALIDIIAETKNL